MKENLKSLTNREMCTRPYFLDLTLQCRRFHFQHLICFLSLYPNRQSLIKLIKKPFSEKRFFSHGLSWESCSVCFSVGFTDPFIPHPLQREARNQIVQVNILFFLQSCRSQKVRQQVRRPINMLESNTSIGLTHTLDVLNVCSYHRFVWYILVAFNYYYRVAFYDNI